MPPSTHTLSVKCEVNRGGLLNYISTICLPVCDDKCEVYDTFMMTAMEWQHITDHEL